MRRLKPLTGQVLVELLPVETHSAGGIEIPNRPLSPEEVQDRHRNPEKPPGLTGIVRAIGPWPKLPNGMMAMPEYGVGAKVVVSPKLGTDLAWDTTRRLKLIRQNDVLAVLT